MSNVLVTGASGFFGRALLPRLKDAHRVTALSRTPPANGDAGQAESLTLDLRDIEATQRALSDWRWDAVVHLAGPAPKTEQTWDDAVDTINAHVQSLLHVTAAIPEGWQGRFVHASGGIVYGIPMKLPVTEDHPRRPLHAYALAKCLAEDILLGSRLKDRWILRMGGLFSEARKAGALFNFVRAAQAGEPLKVTTSNPSVPWEILHVDDAVEAVVRALAASSRDPGALNIGYGAPINVLDIAQGFARRSSRGSTVIASGPKPPTFHADISKARRLIAWPPVTLEQRLDRLWTAFEGCR